MVIDMTQVELDHVKHLQGSRYDFVCQGCNTAYKEKPIDGCEYCESTSFSPMREVVRQLEIGANRFGSA